MKNIIREVLKKQDGSYMSQYLAGLSGGIALFTAGIHFGWVTSSLPKIMSDEYPFSITEDEASYIAIISSIGHVIGGISAATLYDIIGRKRTILAITIPQILSFLMTYFSYFSKELLYIARITGGIGEGAIIASIPIYIAEIADPAIRGNLASLVGMLIIIGALFINIVGSFLDIHTMALINLTFPSLMWLIFTNMPESPYYLLMKNKTEEAAESLKILRRREKIEEELASLTKDVGRQMSEAGGIKELFTIDSNRKAFFLISCSRIIQQFTGCSAFGMYYQILFRTNTDLSPVMGSSVLIAIQILVICIVSRFVEKVGRKPLLVISSGLTGTVLFVLGTFFILRDYTTVDVSHMGWFPLLMMVLFIISFTLGLGVMLNILAAEMYSASIKSKAAAAGSIFFALGIMGSTKFYQVTGDNIGMAVPFYTFSACSLVGVLFFSLALPETKGKTLEVIQQELKGHRRKSEEKI